MTCKDCEKHNECKKKGKLRFDVDNIYELVYQHATDKTCPEFKRRYKNDR